MNTEITSPAAGIVLELRAAEDDTVSVGQVIALIGNAAPQPPPARRRRHLHSPRIRYRASEGGLDLDAISGTGPGGRITEADLADALNANTAPRSTEPAAATLPFVTSTSPVPASSDAVRISPGPLSPAVDLGPSGAVAGCCAELELTGWSGSRARLLSVIASELLAARRPTRSWRAVVVDLADASVGIPNAADLTAGAIERRITHGDSVSVDADVRLVDADGVLWIATAPSGGQAVAVGLGAARPSLSVTQSGTGPLIATTHTAVLTMVYRLDQLDDRSAIAMISAVRRAVAADAAA